MTKAIDKSPAHGTAVAVSGRGFLFVGPSGAGKSGLAIQMMAMGAELISDDQVILKPQTEGILMSAPDSLRGQIEARYFGILSVSPANPVILSHVVDLSAPAATRLPQFGHVEVLGTRIDLIHGQNVPNLASVLMVLGKQGRRV
jgi:HPr kinase/phosphorylase